MREGRGPDSSSRAAASAGGRTAAGRGAGPSRLLRSLESSMAGGGGAKSACTECGCTMPRRGNMSRQGRNAESSIGPGRKAMAGRAAIDGGKEKMAAVTKTKGNAACEAEGRRRGWDESQDRRKRGGRPWGADNEAEGRRQGRKGQTVGKGHEAP